MRTHELILQRRRAAGWAVSAALIAIALVNFGCSKAPAANPAPAATPANDSKTSKVTDPPSNATPQPASVAAAPATTAPQMPPADPAPAPAPAPQPLPVADNSKVSVPDVKGLSLDQARSALAKARLAVAQTNVQITPEGAPFTVSTQNPPASGAVPPGTAVALVMNPGPVQRGTARIGVTLDNLLDVAKA